MFSINLTLNFRLYQVTEFENKFEELLKLENLAKDPARLFQTRGGTLLQEEKQRKRIKVVSLYLL